MTAPAPDDPIQENYRAALRELTRGDAAEVELGGLAEEQVETRLEPAARELGYALRWGESAPRDMLRFQVVVAAMTASRPTPNGAPAAATNPDAARVKAQIDTRRERLIDLTRRNPLLGLNRSRVSKLRVTAPEPTWLYDRLVASLGVCRLRAETRHPGA